MYHVAIKINLLSKVSKRRKKPWKKIALQNEIVPVVFKDRKGNEIVVDTDEHPRPETTLEKLGKLKPIFQGGTVTAGNASGVNDGAAALLIMSADKAKELGLKTFSQICSRSNSWIRT